MIHLTCLLPQPYDCNPSQRYRLEQWHPHLAQHDIDMRLDHLIHDRKILEGLWSSPPDPAAFARLIAASFARLRALQGDRAPDAYVIHREASLLGPPLLEWIAARKAPIIFDLDDAIWLNPPNYRAFSPRQIIRMPSKTVNIMRRSAGISAGNAYIAEFSKTLCDIVEIVPTTVDVSGSYANPKVHSDAAKIVVGWTGSHSTVPFLRAILPALAEARAHTDFKLLVIGGEVQHPALDIECIPWRSSTEAEDLRRVDIGLMPLVDDAWSKGKCGAKALQYMGLGIPTIVSPVGVNADIVEHGRTGFHARDASDWSRFIGELASADVRSRMGALGRDTVIRGYSAEVGAEKFAGLVKRVVRQ